MPPPVLLTRPVQASAELARTLRAHGAEVVVSPLLEIRPVDRLPPLADGLLLTSPNAVATYVALQGPPGLPAWCVGPKTAEQARAAGLKVMAVAPDAEALAALVPTAAPDLVHLRGRIQRGDLVQTLRGRGISARDAVLYDQVAVPLSEAARSCLRAPVIVPLYSPRTAQLFADACRDGDWSNITAIAISQAVADVLPICAIVADTPDGAAMENAILARIR